MILLVFFVLISSFMVLLLWHRMNRPKQITTPIQVIEAKPKESMQRPTSFSLTIDIKALVGVLMADPKAREEIREAIIAHNPRAGASPLPTNQILGNCNLADRNEQPDWHTLFISSSKESGEILRNPNGTRVSFRLRRQTRKNHSAEQGKITAETLPEDHRQLLTKAIQGDAEAAEAVIKMAYGPTTTPATTLGMKVEKGGEEIEDFEDTLLGETEESKYLSGVL